MKDEIKEILNNQKLINVENDYERIIFEYLANNCSEFDDEHIKQLVNLKVEQYKQSLDYITNLQEEVKEYEMIFDTFSKRPYAHRYLEEKKKELGNNKIIGLDSEMIYKDYYNLKEENEKVHKELDYADNYNIYLISKIDKAIEYIKGWQSFPHTNGSTHNELRNLLNILTGGDDND